MSHGADVRAVQRLDALYLLAKAEDTDRAILRYWRATAEVGARLGMGRTR